MYSSMIDLIKLFQIFFFFCKNLMRYVNLLVPMGWKDSGSMPDFRRSQPEYKNHQGHYFMNYFSRFHAFQYDDVPWLPLSPDYIIASMTEQTKVGPKDPPSPPNHLTPSWVESLNVLLGTTVCIKYDKACIYLGPGAHKIRMRPHVQRVIFII